MITRETLRALAKTRLEDAQLLYRSGRHSSAYYLCGYAIELAIKARIAGLIQADSIPDPTWVKKIYTHVVVPPGRNDATAA